MKTWSDSQDAALLKMAAEGLDLVAMADRLGVSVSAARHRLQRLRRETPSGARGRRWTPDEDDRLLSLVADGQSNRQVAEALGRTVTAVHSRLKKLRDHSGPRADAPSAPAARGPSHDPSPPPSARRPMDDVRAERLARSQARGDDLRRIDRLRRVAPAHYPEGAPCRWPEGDPKDPSFRYCGKPSVAGKPYCADHCAVAYQARPEPARKGERAA